MPMPRRRGWRRGRLRTPIARTLNGNAPHLKKCQSKTMGYTVSFFKWCGREDSNFHGLPHSDLNAARLPIPPRPHVAGKSGGSRLAACSKSPYAKQGSATQYSSCFGDKLTPVAATCRKSESDLR